MQGDTRLIYKYVYKNTILSIRPYGTLCVLRYRYNEQ